ncbi:MAG TPA: c-type cytochrome [Herpetosiphonaceae bacterium]
MRKHLITLGIWMVAALVVIAVHWSSTPDTSAARVAASPSPATVSADPAYGKALFMAKGCATCHLHAQANVGSHFAEFGPNLTYYRADPVFLQSWLKDPQSIRPNTQMPNLELKKTEIDALIAFLQTNPPQP